MVRNAEVQQLMGVDRALVAELQLSEEREDDVRTLFKKADKDPKILILTDRLLTGYDAPLLYCLYLDRPMRDHVLLQAVARVDRPCVDREGVQKRIGLVVDFVGVLRELRKALQFDSRTSSSHNISCILSVDRDGPFGQQKLDGADNGNQPISHRSGVRPQGHSRDVARSRQRIVI
jgi:type I site-specific restriction-modification system R (restriction) subunit